MKTLYSFALLILFFFINQIFSQQLKLEFSTFVGGSSEDRAHGMAVDELGNVLITAPIQSTNLPTTNNALVTNSTGIYFSKISEKGDSLLISTYLGKSGGSNYTHGVAVDKDGCIYLVGNTTNSNFPTTENAFDRTFNGPSDKAHGDAFVMKLNPNGTEIIYSTFIGGSGMDIAGKITVDSEGNAYIIGNTGSNDLPVTEGAFDTSFNGGGGFGREDVFVAKLNPDGSELVYCTYIGGSGAELYGSNILVDNLGAVLFAITTASSDIPISENGFDNSYNGGSGEFGAGDGVVIKLSPDGSRIEASTLIGGSGDDFASFIMKDETGNIYVCGSADTADFQITAKIINNSSAKIGYAAKFNPELSELICSYQFDAGINSLAVDKSGNLVIAGVTESNQYPVTDNAFSKAMNGSNDIFITFFDQENEKILYSTFVGGSKNEVLSNLVLKDNIIYLSGNTNSNDFPTSENAFDKTYNGGTSPWGGDAYIMKFNIDDVSSVKNAYGNLINDYNLKQNYPNPFNPETTIQYTISRGFSNEDIHPIKLKIYDMLGRAVKTLVCSYQSAGDYSVVWNGTDNFNKSVSSGTYIYSLLTNEVSYHKKMLLLR